MALQQAMSNSKYATWLNALNIRDVQDFRNLLKGGSAGNLRSLVLVVALNYVSSNSKYSEYVPYIQAAMAAFGLNIGMDGTGSGSTSDDDIINLGPYNGMTVGEVKAVRTQL